MVALSLSWISLLYNNRDAGICLASLLYKVFK